MKNPLYHSRWASVVRLRRPCAAAPGRRRAGSSSRRGAAEIELLLLIPLLVMILFLTWGAGKVAYNRLIVAGTASYEAFKDATDRGSPLYAKPSTLQDLGSIDPSLPPLPNRIHVSDPERTVRVYAGPDQSVPPVTIRRHATTISPALALSSFPVSADDAALDAWFTTYADSATGGIRQPLGLAEPWRP